MMDKKKIEELEKAIKAKQAELNSISAEQENSAADASRYRCLIQISARQKKNMNVFAH